MNSESLRQQMGAAARVFACSTVWDDVFEQLYQTYECGLDDQRIPTGGSNDRRKSDRLITRMLILPILFLLMNALPTRLVPAGTQVHIRLTTTVGSYASAAGSPVSAVLIAPVIVDGETVLPAG